ncbi:unnamed protein product [Kuraishia capsulata CBS 1993]|uniref:Ubiquitin-conjugating enzyme E2 6 n=1 Tax=Kuraishia capsulata CBS 1993 TaxID=1382522 RepID=W6MUS7_9ASCO|nr:uncharacterized protein KUCA_T00001856001 [Kuraishia capsulata CBS 1993]CDK25885.1 unnamed protein product [Kuraishia capsulata CBS 1993]
MASKSAHKRLTKEYRAIQANPPPFIVAKASEQNILEWHYVITGPPETPYEGGQYHGTLSFPTEYPFKPPAIRMTTPNGRFQVNTRLCLSMSDYHPDTWNPGWSVSTILTGLLSFMTGDEPTTGAIVTSLATKENLALASRQFNVNQNPRFVKEFPELVQQNLADIKNGTVFVRKEKPKPVLKKEEPRVSTEKILDPEEKLRAQLLAKSVSQEEEGWSVSTVVMILLVVAVAICGAKLYR